MTLSGRSSGSGKGASRACGKVSSGASSRVSSRAERGIERGIERGRAEERALLCRQAAARFGTDTAERLSGVLAGIADPERLAEVGEWLVRCETGEEFLVRPRVRRDGGESPGIQDIACGHIRHYVLSFLSTASAAGRGIRSLCATQVRAVLAAVLISGFHWLAGANGAFGPGDASLPVGHCGARSRTGCAGLRSGSCRAGRSWRRR